MNFKKTEVSLFGGEGGGEVFLINILFGSMHLKCYLLGNNFFSKNLLKFNFEKYLNY